MTFDELFADVREAGKTAFLPYLMAGVPGEDESVDLFLALHEAGADGFEICLPYADPLMDGPIIQEAGSRALAGGTGLESGLRVASRVAGTTGKPCAVMTYANPLLRVGLDRFFGMAAESGVTAAIVADLPVDEAAPFVEAAAGRGVGMVLFAG